jgi:hypothetical protein
MALRPASGAAVIRGKVADRADRAYVDSVYVIRVYNLFGRSKAPMDRVILDYEFDQSGTICVRLASGPRQIEIVADIAVDQRRGVLHRLHVSGAGPNAMGPAAFTLGEGTTQCR